MSSDFWQKQEYHKPLFEDLIWNKPEQKGQAGNLLIIGGNSHAIGAPSSAYNKALQAGAGYVRVLLPDATRKLLGPKVPTDIELLPSTPSGSFSQKSFDTIASSAAWANAVLLAGDFGRNSETAIVLESLLSTLQAPIIITRDALEYFSSRPLVTLEREGTLLVGSFAQIQKFATGATFKTALTFDMGLVALVSALSEFTLQFKAHIITEYKGVLIVAVDGQVITTKLNSEPATWRLETATFAAVWWLQNPNRPLDALATSLTEVKY